MPSNATHVSPYLTHVVTHHGQSENAGRIRKKNARGDLETVPAAPAAGRRRKGRVDAAAATNRPGVYNNSNLQQADRLVRSPARPRSAYSNALEIPDEPPPSFEEAMSSPSYSIGPSAALDPPHSHHPTPRSRLRHETPSTPALLDDIPSPAVTNESTESLQFIDREEGIEPENRGRAARIQADSRSSRRHLSLSPLRTLTTLSKQRRNNLETMSQPGSPGSVTSFSSPFGRSAHSLTLLPSSSSSPPSRSGTMLSRRIFSSRNKAREVQHEQQEDDSDWLVVDREIESPVPSRPPSVLSHVPSIPPSVEPPVPSRPLSVASSSASSFRTASPSSLRTISIVDDDEEQQSTSSVHEEDDRSSSHTPTMVSSSHVRPNASPLSTASWISQTDYAQSYCTALSERSISESTIREESDPGTTTFTGTSHYPGRPLPRPPVPSTHRSIYDSIYAGPSTAVPSSPPCPEGMLIDFEESAGRSDSQDTVREYEDAQSSRSSYASSSYTTAAGSSVRYSDVTELDVLASRFTDENSRRGSDYESLLMLQEFLGPAQSSTPTPRTQSPASTRPSSMALFGQVTVERRRVTKDGRVKLKLTMRDVAVDKCGICLVQFKAKDRASMSSGCRHVFHESCLGRWLGTNRSKTCPTCREPIEAA